MSDKTDNQKIYFFNLKQRFLHDELLYTYETLYNVRCNINNGPTNFRNEILKIVENKKKSITQ